MPIPFEKQEECVHWPPHTLKRMPQTTLFVPETQYTGSRPSQCQKVCLGRTCLSLRAEWASICKIDEPNRLPLTWVRAHPHENPRISSSFSNRYSEAAYFEILDSVGWLVKSRANKRELLEGGAAFSKSAPKYCMSVCKTLVVCMLMVPCPALVVVYRLFKLRWEAKHSNYDTESTKKLVKYNF